jgi:hypothetical protein
MIILFPETNLHVDLVESLLTIATPVQSFL